jgi:AcrR family transcriptional regulator
VTGKATNGAGRRERRKEQTRRQIFLAAMKLFEKKGVFETTVEEITDAADVGKGTFFNYFPIKEAVLSVLAERQLGVLQDAAEKARTAKTIYPLLQEMCTQLASVLGGSAILLRSVFAVVLSNKLLFETFSAVLLKGRGIVAGIMERGQQLGEVRADIPALELARSLQQAAFGTSLIWSVGPAPELAQLQLRTVELFWRGIAVNPQAVLKRRTVKNEAAVRHES